MKQCSSCALEQPSENFYRNGPRLQSQCKKCLYQKQKARVSKNKEMVAAYQAEYYKQNRDRLLSYCAEYRQQHRERLKAIRAGMRDWLREYNREYHAANRDKVLARQRQYKAENKDRIAEYRESNLERDRLARKKWAAKNKHAVNAKAAKRRSMLRNAVPLWADFEEIASIYAEAQKTPGLHVDHIVPLVSEIVCGLHCEANLRITSALENLSKGNRHWPDMP